jgi:hypothetical protein
VFGGIYFELMFTLLVLFSPAPAVVVVVVVVVDVDSGVVATLAKNFLEEEGVVVVLAVSPAALVDLVVLVVSPLAVVLSLLSVSGLFFGVFPKNNL